MPTTSSAITGIYDEVKAPEQPTEIEAEVVEETTKEDELTVLKTRVAVLEKQNNFLANELRKKIDQFVGLKMVHGEIPAELVGQLVSSEIAKINDSLVQLEQN